MKKWMALCLCVLMLLSALTACGNNAENGLDGKEEFSVVGEWTGTCDMTELFATVFEMYDITMEDYYSKKIKADVVFTFNDDGTCELVFDEELYNVLVPVYKAVIEGWTDKQLKKEGLDMTLNEYMKEKGLTWDDLLKEFGLDEDLVSSFNNEADYEFKDGKLYTDDGEATVEIIDNDKIIYTEEQDGIELSVTLKRK